MDLYGLLPAGVRYYDRFASQKVLLDSGETTLQKILYALEQEADVTDGLIDGLRDLLNPETCRVEFLPHLTRFLGIGFFSYWPEGRKRLFVSALGKLYHISGQKESWKAVLNILSYSGAYPLELWKEQVYEDYEYSRYGGGSGYYYLYHAARVDVLSKSGATLNQTLSAEEKALLDNFRPIHVLIRPNSLLVSDSTDSVQDLDSDNVSPLAALSVEEALDGASDVCAVLCETRCEAACEAGSCEGTFEITVTCILTCEVGCETGSCEITCEFGSEWNGQLTTLDPTTGVLVIVYAQNGLLYDQAGIAVYNGFIQVTDPTSPTPVTILMIGGEFWEEDGFSKFNGNIQMVQTINGQLHTFNIVNGRIQ